MVFEILFITITPILLALIYLQLFYTFKILKEWDKIKPGDCLRFYEKEYGTYKYATVEFMGFNSKDGRYMCIRTALGEILTFTPISLFFSGWKK